MDVQQALQAFAQAVCMSPSSSVAPVGLKPQYCLVPGLAVVLLMVVLGVEELGRRQDLRGDRVPADALESLLVGGLRLLGNLPLLLRVVVDAGTVLRPPVVTLLVQRGGVVALPEDLQQLRVGDGLRVVHDADDLVVVRGPRAHVPVGGVRNAAAGVADLRGEDALHLHVDVLRAPEAAHAEHCLLHARRPRRVHLRALHEVLRICRRGVRDGGLGAGRRPTEEGPPSPELACPVGSRGGADEASRQEAPQPQQEQRGGCAAPRRANAARHRGPLKRAGSGRFYTPAPQACTA
eukprot:CAMPEP_0175408274 /NCGR_PEP_ID=MMETSP0095-20121207/40507_1 /TAXON_ID=311494 /ORGANISM="Alexandrium monilatum, Strain CCMP3105" /LENGTH=292 /DNA_ID=CAMNT_0016707185 /DNA_START=50 /DNA_END=923 /DNA_ORIENTATION=+